MRRSLSSKRDEAAFKAKQQLLEGLKRREDEGELDLYFYDEAGFSLLPSVPYAWQAKGETALLSSGRSKSLNVLGLLKRSGDFSSYVVEGSVDSNTVVAMLADFVAGLETTRKAVIVLDNAPTHSSEVFEAKRQQWQERNVEVCYLCSYSPELNLIERLWQEIKYRWLPFEAFLSFQNLRDNLMKVLAKVGSDLTISFA